MIGTILGWFTGGSIKTYLYFGVAAILSVAATLAYNHYQGLLTTIDTQEQDIINLNVVIANRDHTILERDNQIGILKVQQESYKESIEDGFNRVKELKGNLVKVKRKYKDDIKIWEKKFNRLAEPFQKHPHLVIKLINDATSRMFKRINKDTNSREGN